MSSYGRNDDRQQSEIQHIAPWLVNRAVVDAGLDPASWLTQPKGDEQLSIAPLDGSEPRVVDALTRYLASALSAYNAQRRPDARLRLRCAVHHGPVEVSGNGFAGRAVVDTCRLLNCLPARRALESTAGANLVLVLSDDVYRATVAGGHTTLNSTDLQRVEVAEKEYQGYAWLWIPGHEDQRSADVGNHADDRRAAVAPLEVAPSVPEEHPAYSSIRAEQVNVNTFQAAVDMRNSVLGFGDSRG